MATDDQKKRAISIAAFLPIEHHFDADSGELPVQEPTVSEARKEAFARRIAMYLDEHLPRSETMTQKGPSMSQTPAKSASPAGPFERYVRDGVTMLRFTAKEGLARLAELLAPQAQPAFRDGSASLERQADWNRLEGFEWLPGSDFEEYDGETRIILRTPVGVPVPDAAPEVLVALDGRIAEVSMDPFIPGIGQIILRVPAVGIVALSISTVFDGHLRLNVETDD